MNGATLASAAAAWLRDALGLAVLVGLALGLAVSVAALLAF